MKEGGWIFDSSYFLVLLFFIPQYLKHSEKGKKFYDKFSLQIPIFWRFYKKGLSF